MLGNASTDSHARLGLRNYSYTAYMLSHRPSSSHKYVIYITQVVCVFRQALVSAPVLNFYENVL